MSYRDDLKGFSAQRKNFKKVIVTAIAATVVLLTALMLATVTMISVELINSWNGSSGGGNDGGGSGSVTKTEIVLKNGGDTIYLVVNDGDGDTVAWRDYVKATGGATLTFDNSNVNITKEGKYVLKCTAKSSTGKTVNKDVTVIVTGAQYTYDELMTIVGLKAKALGISANMSTAEKVRKIYEYVNSPGKEADKAMINFNNKSLTKSIKRDDWEFGWVTEAYLAFNEFGDNDSRTSGGDCYTYYSVSKAFFEYFGIEHVGIRRDTRFDEKHGTHFWMMVNVGTKSSPRWYYYDATRLAGTFGETKTNNGCLLTLAELQSYIPREALTCSFYEFDPDKYPKATTQSIQK